MKALIAIDHPNLVRVLQLLDTPNHFYVVTEFVPGGNLLDAMAKYRGFTD